jgi:predicted RNA-binding Zn ribbon-like protein
MAKTPSEAGRLIDFLNSRPKSERPDGLGTVESATRLLEELGIANVRIGAVGLERLRRLRDALTVLADRERNERGRTCAWDAMNDIAGTVATTVRFVSDDESTIAPAGTGVDSAIGALIADLHTAVKSGHWTRVRLCAYEPCSAAFYDATRSRTQRWHSYAACGNRVNVGAYRRRSARPTTTT